MGNMPSWVKDEDIWDKAKKAAGDDAAPALVTHVYKKLGGAIGEGAPADLDDKEAASASTLGALQRAGCKAAEADSWHGKSAKFVRFNEANVDSGKREVRCILITEGPGNLRDRNYYTADFVAEAAKKYNGARAYLNHATEAEFKGRPEGDIRQLCGYYKDTKVISTLDRKTGMNVAAVEGTLCLDESAAGNEALAKAEAQVEYSKIFPDSPEEYCGLSISGSGVREGQAEINGQKWNRIVGVGQADSVDVVTRPARGGAFLALTESAGKAPHLPKEEAIMLKKLMAITAEITEATKALSEAKTDEARSAAKVKVDALTKQLKEAAVKAEDEADVKKFNGDTKDEMDEADLKKLIPQGEAEDEAAYKTRLAKVKAAKSMKADESVKADMSADDLRTKFPKLFEAVASRVRESEAEKGEDIKAVKTELREAKLELQVMRDKELATKLLSEAGVPTKLIGVGDLLGLTEAEMKREIEKVQALIEAAGGRVFVPASKAIAPKGSKLAESIQTLNDKAGV